MTEYWKMVLEGPGKGLEFFITKLVGTLILVKSVILSFFLSLKYICNSILSC